MELVTFASMIYAGPDGSVYGIYRGVLRRTKRGNYINMNAKTTVCLNKVEFGRLGSSWEDENNRRDQLRQLEEQYATPAAPRWNR